MRLRDNELKASVLEYWDGPGVLISEFIQMSEGERPLYAVHWRDGMLAAGGGP